MELINYLLAFAKTHPIASLIVAGLFLFVYTVVVLRKRRAFMTSAAESLPNGVRNSPFAPRLEHDVKTQSASYIHVMVGGVFATILVYFWWVPLMILTLPIVLAIAATYPDKIKNLLSKTVKE